MRRTRRSAVGRLAALSLVPWLPIESLADAASVNGAPRVALLLGNGAYRALPPLKNPKNDVDALAARLNEARFDVISRTDSEKAAMEEAIKAFCAALADGKGIGLFFFSGHGVQVDWRNYLVPVDAALKSVQDVARGTVDLGTILAGLGRARNPMNIVILDACRDNPFAAELRTGKGLSQVDAPVGTLLAYSTSPGNTADDGEGDHGLYTESLLKEMRAPEAKIEDVFKRVRLTVRRASHGQQIPWESTSLEDDFYFVPPARIARPTTEEADRRYAEERALWEQVEAKATAADARARGLDS